ncbi:acyl-CoA thioesterase/bile acid-CoA:amino acid N-acyltransferase family protein [Halobacterium wangiae]|uniref:acyl-CoA thioesterase/bile acid-CoA:amino acid N-acyltransferase family protein n=1 Tax=Halobacterium wangiae TaxID=2902623 RepID=UPI001E4BF5B3|nr:acyl-CoA thioesterase/bile acid-CoA:amino acid N-acyltransferase family protein [Halobacterium wangiae]
MTTDDNSGTLAIDAPDRAPNDEPTPIRVTGAPPNATVDFDATLTAEDGVEWRSTATLTSDDDGVVDLATDAPDAGTWSGAEPMAWLWSMRPDDEDVRFPALGGPSYTVDLHAATEDDSATRTVTRVRWSDDVTARDVDRDGVAGTLYCPPGDGPHPGVVDLHGSAGRLSDDGARRLATEGFATLALHYAGEHDALPDELANVPLSYVDDAADWLRDQDAVAGEQFGGVGVSRGAELALLLGARRDWVGAVVSYSGSVPWDTPRDDPAWLDDGEVVPHLTAEEAPRFEDLDEEPVADVTPAVEETDGPVLLLSGGDDQVWNSRRLSEAVADRLREHEFPHDFEHRTYDDVGHLIGTPYAPLGGFGDETRQRATARAGEDAWPAVLDCLETGLRE